MRNQFGMPHPTPYLCPIPPARDPEEANAALRALRVTMGFACGVLVFFPVVIVTTVCIWWPV